MASGACFDKSIYLESCDKNRICRRRCRRIRSTPFLLAFFVNRAMLSLVAFLLLSENDYLFGDTGLLFCRGEKNDVPDTASLEKSSENEEPSKKTEKEEKISATTKQSSLETASLSNDEENGIKVLSQVDDIMEAVSTHVLTPTLMIMLVYSPHCPHSRGLLFRFETAAAMTSSYFAAQEAKAEEMKVRLKGRSLPPGVIFSKLDATLVTDQEWLADNLELEAYPTLVFVRRHEGVADDDTNNIVALDYLGAQSTPTEIFETVLHNWFRLVLPSSFSDSSTNGEIASGPGLPVFVVESYSEMHSFLELYGTRLVRHAGRAFNPDTTKNERQYINWLLELESDAVDDFIIFVQCRPSQPAGEVKEYYDSFNYLAHTMSNRRDVAYFSLQDCSQAGEVLVFTIPGTAVESGRVVSGTTEYWSELLESGPRFQPSDVQDSIQSKMTEFIVTQSTPPVMWYDRKSIAPLAFPIYRQVHAVIFVNFHRPNLGKELDEPFFDSEDSLETRAAIRDLRKAVIHHRRKYPLDDMVALVVPSTETRIMNTFGIDIWRPLDEFIESSLVAKNEEENRATEPYPKILPSLLVTDQRKHRGTQRYYLDYKDMAGKNPSAIQNFIADFWDGQLQPEIQSQGVQDVVVNESGVQSITGNTFVSMVLDQTDKHTLLYLYAPTCGHCKRFSLLWNELCRLIKYLKWDTFIDVMKMDITNNEIVSKRFQLETVKSVPDVYYFPLGNKEQAVRFDILDEFGDGAGRLSDPLDVLDWLIDISEGEGGLTEEALLNLMKELEPEDFHEVEGMSQEDTTTV